MPTAEKITVWTIEFDDKCPFRPEGMTKYEAQEIGRLWRNAVSSYQKAITRANTRLGRLVTGTTVDGDPTWIETRPMANDIQKLAIAVAAEHALGEFINAVEHRLALAKREES